jgi:ATP-dependent Zn protease
VIVRNGYLSPRGCSGLVLVLKKKQNNERGSFEKESFFDSKKKSCVLDADFGKPQKKKKEKKEKKKKNKANLYFFFQHIIPLEEKSKDTMRRETNVPCYKNRLFFFFFFTLFFFFFFFVFFFFFFYFPLRTRALASNPRWERKPRGKRTRAQDCASPATRMTLTTRNCAMGACCCCCC